MASASTSPWTIAGGLAALGGLVAILVSITRESLGAAESQTADSLQRDLAADVRIPFRVRRWSQAVALAAVRTLPSSFQRGTDALSRLAAWARVILAVMDRESYGGDLLTPRGPGGVGDPTPRKISRVPLALRPLLRVVGTDAKSGEATVVPADNAGWGRGLMQLDWMSQTAARDGRWRDPNVNIQLGAELLGELFASWTLADGRGNDPLRLALASYNAGAATVGTAIQRGLSPDTYTHGADYGADVVRRAREAGATV